MCMLGRNRTRASAVTTGIEARVADGLAGTALGLLGVELDINDHVGAVLGIIGSCPRRGWPQAPPKGKPPSKGLP